MKVLLIFLISIFSEYCGNAQSLTPVVIASQGDYFSSSTVSISWTIGEVMSETYSTSNHFLTQGFHQPNAISEISFEFFDGFSPNGDGINDWWKIPVLSYYTSNSVEIINRWGSEVWEKDNYDNKNIVFRGENMNGENLPDGTYYYTIRYNNIEKRGWVFIKR